MKPMLLALCLLTATAGGAVAMENPRQSADDYRIRFTAYNPNDTVRLDAVIGIATHIVVDPGEEYVTHAFGDPNGWDFAHKGNHYFVKPRAENSDTNLVVVTSKRTYNFLLHFVGDYPERDKDGTVVTHSIKTPWSLKSATLQVTFSYPSDEATAASQKAKAAMLEDRFNGEGGYHNLNYTMSATPRDMEIAPMNVWDNGRFTFFKFAQNVDLPNVYTVGTDGSEALVNRHMSPHAAHIIVAEKVAPKFFLRLGDDVVGIYNESFDPVGESNTTGTSSPAVKRIIKQGKQP